MESLSHLRLPFPRRLTKMYTDTKSSYDFFVKEPISQPTPGATDPELTSLHRKLRIQKDRLVSWGLEWSDPAGRPAAQSPDIDESISKAGLSELVGSVMGTIKEVLAEAEPLWLSSRRGLGGDEKSPVGPAGEKSKGAQLVIWDKTRFEDLVRDLTMSIDTLYDLSRTRQSARRAAGLKAEGAGVEGLKREVQVEERGMQFESTRMQTPQQIDPSTLVWPRDLKNVKGGMLQPAKSARQIVFMRKPMSFNDARATGMKTLPIVPVLLEYACYNPIYSITGISPSMTRFEKLFAALSQTYSQTDRLFSGLLRLIGYFEEAEHSRFCLLYALPTHFGPVDVETPRMPVITILSDLLSSNYEPSLEVKYRLAYNVANAVFDLHSKGVVHGNVVSSNVLFIEPQPQNRLDLTQVNMRQSFLASFDLFSDNATDSSEPAPMALHRYPLDPRTTKYTHLTSESKSLDLYSLAMLLLEIGLWRSLPDIFNGSSVIPENPISVFKKLASRCGSLYLKAVQACWQSPDDELSQKARPDVMHQKVCWKVSKALDACCAIDEVSDTENESDDSLPAPSTPAGGVPSTPMGRKLAAPVLPNTTSEKTIDWSEKPSYSQATSSITTYSEKTGWSEKPAIKPSTPIQIPSSTPKPKLRTYPAIRIAPEHLHYWHTGLMPHINHVLRNFYKKYPESVEISLESIGESPSTTKPTILIICTSVTKVRSILKKSLAYDKETYGLKVCRGKVVRSRGKGARRSMAKRGTEAKNAGFQERPGNGASIGACVEGRHLPPVSFGGLVVVDGKSYGMTVHHMLDEPSEDSDSENEDFDPLEPVLRSSGRYNDMPELTYSESSVYSSGDEEYMYELSDYESDSSSNSPYASDSEGDEDSPQSRRPSPSPYHLSSRPASSPSFHTEDSLEPGDIPGIPPSCGESYVITQPAIDDIPIDFYPDPSTRDEEHLDSCSLGEVYASSGIRRRTENNLIHEIDWALFEFNEYRLPEENTVSMDGQVPLQVAKTEELGGLAVHCRARTSGLQTGLILPAMTSVKIYGRQTPSSSYQVAGRQLGIPGDSGAWIISSDRGNVCGHVLAYSPRKRVAYICPMDVLIQDIGLTLDAKTISFPSGEEIWSAEPKMEDMQQDMEDLLRDLQISNPKPSSLPNPEPLLDERDRENAGDVTEGKESIPIRLLPQSETRLKQREQTLSFVSQWDGRKLGGSGTGIGGITYSAEEVDSGIEVEPEEVSAR